MPEDKKTIVKMAHIYSQEGRWDRAIAEYKKLIALEPEDFNSHSTLGDVYFKKGDLQSAFETYLLCFDAYSRLGQADKAALAQSKLLKIDPMALKEEDRRKLGMVRRLQEADALYEAGEWSKAAAGYDAVLRLDPDRFDLYIKVGDLLLKVGDRRGACARYKEIGNLYLNNRLVRKALAVFQKVLEIFPDDFETHAALADLHVKAGNESEAKKELLYVTEVLFLRGDLDRAAQFAQRAEQLKAIESYNYLGHIEFKRGHPDQARVWFDKLLKFKPSHGGALWGMAQVHLAEGRQADALQALAKVAKTDRYYGEVLATRADLDAAERPDDARAAYLEAFGLLRARGAFALAREVREKALKLGVPASDLSLPSVEADGNYGETPVTGAEPGLNRPGGAGSAGDQGSLAASPGSGDGPLSKAEDERISVAELGTPPDRIENAGTAGAKSVSPDATKADTTKADGVKADGTKADGAKVDGAKIDGAKVDGAKVDGAKVDGTKADGVKADGTKADGAKVDGAKVDGAKVDGTKADGAKVDGIKADGAKVDGTKVDGAKVDGTKVDGAKVDGAKADGAKVDGAKADGVKVDGAKADGAKVDGAKTALGMSSSSANAAAPAAGPKGRESSASATTAAAHTTAASKSAGPGAKADKSAPAPFKLIRGVSQFFEDEPGESKAESVGAVGTGASPDSGPAAVVAPEEGDSRSGVRAEELKEVQEFDAILPASVFEPEARRAAAKPAELPELPPLPPLPGTGHARTSEPERSLEEPVPSATAPAPAAAMEARTAAPPAPEDEIGTLLGLAGNFEADEAWDEALNLYQRVLALNKDHAQAREGMSRVYRQLAGAVPRMQDRPSGTPAPAAPGPKSMAPAAAPGVPARPAAAPASAAPVPASAAPRSAPAVPIAAPPVPAPVPDAPSAQAGKGGPPSDPAHSGNQVWRGANPAPVTLPEDASREILKALEREHEARTSRMQAEIEALKASEAEAREKSRKAAEEAEGLRARMEREIRERLEQELGIQAARNARGAAKADDEARRVAEVQARLKAEEEAKHRAALQAKTRADEDARRQAEVLSRVQAQQRERLEPLRRTIEEMRHRVDPSRPGPPVEREAATSALAREDALGGLDDFMTAAVADIYVKQGLIQEGRRIYEGILAREPGNAEVRAKLAALSHEGTPASAPAPNPPAPAADPSVRSADPDLKVGPGGPHGAAPAGEPPKKSRVSYL